jgi:hypothetical protein
VQERLTHAVGLLATGYGLLLPLQSPSQSTLNVPELQLQPIGLPGSVPQMPVSRVAVAPAAVQRAQPNDE